MIRFRLKPFVVVPLFCVGTLIGYLISRTWFISWSNNDYVILSDTLLPPRSIVVPLETSRPPDATSSVKVLCMVLSRLETSKAQRVYETWGQRCDSIFFLAARHMNGLPTVVIPPSIEESRETLWEKVVFGFSSAYSNYFEKADWFLKADDDTYVVMENLKSLLRRYNSSDPLYFGCRFQRNYMSGGAGYVLSRNALKRFIEKSWRLDECRKGVSSSEDVNMGKCLQKIGVQPVDTRDMFGRERFLVILPFKDGALVPGHAPHDFWYWTSMYYPVNDWFDCCAESIITLHYVEPREMILIDFFLYHLSPYQR